MNSKNWKKENIPAYLKKTAIGIWIIMPREKELGKK
jgi:hypothetical protein